MKSLKNPPSVARVARVASHHLVKLLNVEHTTDEEIKILLEETLETIVKFYDSPVFTRFNLIEFHTKKSMVYIIITNLIDLQMSLKTEIGTKVIIDKHLKDFIQKYPRMKPFVGFLKDIFDDISNGHVYSKEDFIGVFQDDMLALLKSQAAERYDDFIKVDEYLHHIEDINGSILDITLSYKQFKERLDVAFDLVVSNYAKFTNIYPEYYKNSYRYPDKDIMESIELFVYNKFKIENLMPTDGIIDITEKNLKPKEVIRVTGPKKFIGSFTWNIIRRLYSCLEYRPYVKTENNLAYLK